MTYTPTERAELLACQSLADFLVRLRQCRAGATQGDVAELLSRHGRPVLRQSVCFYENGRRGITSAAQLAYVRAFGLDAELSLHLQELAGTHTERQCA